jgi:glycerophosphoryl diester phosphodiesterase
MPATRRIQRIAHRGASARAPENTLAAFEEAVRLGVDAIELDVHLSADGVPVVIHDGSVDRTTDGHGPVAAFTVGALQALDAGSWFAPRFRAERIPSLAQALECARGRCGLIIEIKEPEQRRRARGGRDRTAEEGIGRLVDGVARVVTRNPSRDLIVISSFSAAALIRVRAAMPRARLGLLASRSARGALALHREVGLHGFHPHLRLATRRRILAAHRLGLDVIVWPVNDRGRMRRLVALGADGLMSDDPALFPGLDPAGVRLDKAVGL